MLLTLIDGKSSSSDFGLIVVRGSDGVCSQRSELISMNI